MRLSAICKIVPQKNLAKCGGHGKMRKCAVPKRHPEIRCQNCCLGVHTPQQALTMIAKDKRVCRSKRTQKRSSSATARAARCPQRIVKYISTMQKGVTATPRNQPLFFYTAAFQHVGSVLRDYAAFFVEPCQRLAQQNFPELRRRKDED